MKSHTKVTQEEDKAEVSHGHERAGEGQEPSPEMSDNDADDDKKGGNDHDADDAVTVPEHFQKAVHSTLQMATHPHMIDHLASRAYEHRTKLEEAKRAKESKGKEKVGDTPSTYSDEDMPKS